MQTTTTHSGMLTNPQRSRFALLFGAMVQGPPRNALPRAFHVVDVMAAVLGTGE